MKRIEIGTVTLILTEKTAAEVEYELNGGRQGEMERLVRAWLVNGDQMAGDIWSDLWKDEYGCRPRFTREEVRRMYGL